VLEELFATWGQGATSNLPRQRARLPGGSFNLMGAAYGAKGVHGLKAYAGLKGGQFHTLLYSSSDGRLKAMIEADLFGQMRTGAASGLATRLLARTDARTLGVIGTGRQSRTQVLAVCAVRPIKRVNVFARTPEHRESYARAMEKELGLEVVPVASGEACVAEADVVVTITKSAEPVCRAEWLAPGAHVNAAGANSADRREVDAETVLRAAVKLTDHVEQAKVEAGEFRDLVAAGKLAWSDIRELGELVTGKAKGRTSPSELTLFKSLGIALEDVAFAELVYQRALAAGAGRPIPV
jgi:ornithine cyclodeaminase/alanine dehydrogenase